MILTEADKRISPLGTREAGGFHWLTEWYLAGWIPTSYQYAWNQIVIPNTTTVSGIATGQTSIVTASYIADCLTTPYFHFRTDLAHWATPWLTGQRCLRAELLQEISFEAAQGYAIETALTVAAKQNQWRVVRVALTGVYHIPSENHRGLWRRIRTRGRRYGQIIRAWQQASGNERFSVRKRLFKKTG